MDALLTSAAVILLVLFVCILYFLKGFRSKGDHAAPPAVVQNQPVARQRDLGLPAAAAARRRRARRQAQIQPNDDESGGDEEFEVDDELEAAREDGKVGTKKLRKLEEKAARRAQHQAEEEERHEKKAREEKLEKERRKQELRNQMEEAAKAAEEEKLREEQRKKEEEEYLKLKEAFTVDEEGVDAVEEEDLQNLLQEFLSYIKQMKVVMLEDLASHFKIKTQDAIDRIKTLQEDGQLSGIIDDRGKFIYITLEEYEAVGKFMKQRGRVSITDLADSMNRLINLNPDSAKISVTPVAVATTF